MVKCCTLLMHRAEADPYRPEPGQPADGALNLGACALLDVNQHSFTKNPFLSSPSVKLARATIEFAATHQRLVMFFNLNPRCVRVPDGKGGWHCLLGEPQCTAQRHLPSTEQHIKQVHCCSAVRIAAAGGRNMIPHAKQRMCMQPIWWLCSPKAQAWLQAP